MGVRTSKLPSHLRAPEFIWWDITKRCNHRCLHCYSDSAVPMEAELSRAEALHLVSQIASMGVFYVYILGGEPLMRPDFLDVVAAAQREGVGVAFNTNGWFISPEVARAIRNRGVRKVRVSLDGASAETHDSFRRKPGSFSHVVAGLENLHAAGFRNVSVVSTITKRTVTEVSPLISLVKELGASDIQLLPLSAVGRGGSNYDELGLDDEDFAQLRREVAENRRRYEQSIHVYSVDGVLDSNCTACVRRGNVIPDFMGCRAGRTAVNVDADGSVIPCLLVRTPVFGNVREDSLAEIWSRSPRLLEWRRRQNDRPECHKCDLYAVCGRECPASPSQERVGTDARISTLKRLSTTHEGRREGCQSAASLLTADCLGHCASLPALPQST